LIDDPTVLEFVGLLFSAYVTGWGAGYLFYVFKRAADIL
tara:strand:+ start:104 stop:220 length:117 start_codon:yes stop_codon:yes gene_type:complete